MASVASCFFSYSLITTFIINNCIVSIEHCLAIFWFLGWNVIQIMKSSGPRSDPCGTSHIMFLFSDSTFSYFNYWSRSLRQESSNFTAILRSP